MQQPNTISYNKEYLNWINNYDDLHGLHHRKQYFVPFVSGPFIEKNPEKDLKYLLWTAYTGDATRFLTDDVLNYELEKKQNIEQVNVSNLIAQGFDLRNPQQITGEVYTEFRDKVSEAFFDFVVFKNRLKRLLRNSNIRDIEDFFFIYDIFCKKYPEAVLFKAMSYIYPKKTHGIQQQNLNYLSDNKEAFLKDIDLNQLNIPAFDKTFISDNSFKTKTKSSQAFNKIVLFIYYKLFPVDVRGKTQDQKNEMYKEIKNFLLKLQKNE